MKLDSEEQRSLLIGLLAQVPFQGTVGALVDGGLDKLKAQIVGLVLAIQSAEIEKKNDGDVQEPTV